MSEKGLFASRDDEYTQNVEKYTRNLFLAYAFTSIILLDRINYMQDLCEKKKISTTLHSPPPFL